MSVESVTTIRVQYQFIDGYHVFTSEDVYGLYVASRNPEKAFGNIQASIEQLIKLNHGINIEVAPAQTIPEFLKVGTGGPKIPHPAIINESRDFLLRRIS